MVARSAVAGGIDGVTVPDGAGLGVLVILGGGETTTRRDDLRWGHAQTKVTSGVLRSASTTHSCAAR